MSKFELDTQALNTEQAQKSTRITSNSLCTPGCNPTATLCTSCIFACT
ncbi:gallidermin/nisin family lantibiotic [Listeria monocytogenes]|nr:gallidermin/nisin family lantibiotic [Listeria monocytogenes]EII2166242.1 gallidermin/nisin family lantibiotic [Listeria monocytogenes]EII2287560.1 gallidermin/nisin family lantibiotic [Listeria monocytogenes]